MTWRVLIADDHDEMRLMISMLVSRSDGFAVVGEASDGDEAIALAAATTPDVVLLDVNMPQKNGFEALPDLRRLLPDAAIVMFSGFESGHLAERALKLGADAYVEKGTPGPDLIARVRRLLEDRAS